MSSSGEIIKREIRESLVELGYASTTSNVNIIYHKHLGDMMDRKLKALIKSNSYLLER